MIYRAPLTRETVGMMTCGAQGDGGRGEGGGGAWQRERRPRLRRRQGGGWAPRQKRRIQTTGFLCENDDRRRNSQTSDSTRTISESKAVWAQSEHASRPKEHY
jgi:hypothetical protein